MTYSYSFTSATNIRVNEAWDGGLGTGQRIADHSWITLGSLLNWLHVLQHRLLLTLDKIVTKKRWKTTGALVYPSSGQTGFLYLPELWDPETSCPKPIQSDPNFRKNPILCQWIASLQFQYTLFVFSRYFRKPPAQTSCWIHVLLKPLPMFHRVQLLSSEPIVGAANIGQALSAGGAWEAKPCIRGSSRCMFSCKTSTWALITSSVTQLLLNSKHNL